MGMASRHLLAAALLAGFAGMGTQNAIRESHEGGALVHHRQGKRRSYAARNSNAAALKRASRKRRNVAARASKRK